MTGSDSASTWGPRTTIAGERWRCQPTWRQAKFNQGVRDGMIEHDPSPKGSRSLSTDRDLDSVEFGDYGQFGVIIAASSAEDDAERDRNGRRSPPWQIQRGSGLRRSASRNGTDWARSRLRATVYQQFSSFFSSSNREGSTAEGHVTPREASFARPSTLPV